MEPPSIESGSSAASGEQSSAARPAPRVVIAFIGTGPYNLFLEPFMQACTTYLFPECDIDFVILSDRAPAQLNSQCHFFPLEHVRWPFITLRRFSILLQAEQVIEQADWFLYLDADMKVLAPVAWNEIFDCAQPLTAVRHPYVGAGQPFPLERNRASRAFTPPGEEGSIYWQGCLWGGRSDAILEMLRELAESVAEDERNGVMAVWHDESHLNRYLSLRAGLVRTLDPGFAYPEGDATLPFEPRILHLDKNDLAYGNTGSGKPPPAMLLSLYLRWSGLLKWLRRMRQLTR